MCVGGGGGESGVSKHARADVQTIAVKSAGKERKTTRIDASMFAN